MQLDSASGSASSGSSASSPLPVIRAATDGKRPTHQEVADRNKLASAGPLQIHFRRPPVAQLPALRFHRASPQPDSQAALGDNQGPFIAQIPIVPPRAGSHRQRAPKTGHHWRDAKEPAPAQRFTLNGDIGDHKALDRHLPDVLAPIPLDDSDESARNLLGELEAAERDPSNRLLNGITGRFRSWLADPSGSTAGPIVDTLSHCDVPVRDKVASFLTAHWCHEWNANIEPYGLAALLQIAPSFRLEPGSVPAPALREMAHAAALHGHAIALTKLLDGCGAEDVMNRSAQEAILRGANSGLRLAQSIRSLKGIAQPTPGWDLCCDIVRQHTAPTTQHSTPSPPARESQMHPTPVEHRPIVAEPSSFPPSGAVREALEPHLPPVLATIVLGYLPVDHRALIARLAEAQRSTPELNGLVAAVESWLEKPSKDAAADLLQVIFRNKVLDPSCDEVATIVADEWNCKWNQDIDPHQLAWLLQKARSFELAPSSMTVAGIRAVAAAAAVREYSAALRKLFHAVWDADEAHLPARQALLGGAKEGLEGAQRLHATRGNRFGSVEWRLCADIALTHLGTSFPDHWWRLLSQTRDMLIAFGGWYR